MAATAAEYQAVAIQAYARQAKNKGLEIDAAEIRFRAERRLGEMLKEQKANGGMNTGAATIGVGKRGSASEPRLGAPPTLGEAGIDKKLSSRAQAMADVPEEAFEEELSAE